MRLLITRPADDAARLEDPLKALGIEPVVEPLLTIEPVAGASVDLDGVQALLATSANAVRVLAARDPRRDLPVLSVGEASAGTAREAGFANVFSAAGDVDDLARLVLATLDPKRGALLHVVGSHVAGDLALRLTEAGFVYRRLVLYAARAAERFSPAVEDALGHGRLQGAVFFSPRTAATFARLAAEHGLLRPIQSMVAFCLSGAVADTAAKLAWREVIVARRPDQAALLDSIARYLARSGNGPRGDEPAKAPTKIHE